jgi:hypothetical protein
MKPAEEATAHLVDTETKSVFDIPPDEARKVRLDSEAVADRAAGHAIPLDVVGEWLMNLAGWQKSD